MRISDSKTKTNPDTWHYTQDRKEGLGYFLNYSQDQQKVLE